MTEFNPMRSVLPAQRRNSAQRQPRKLLVALVLLLVALAILLIKDRDFWFGTEQATIESDMPATQAAQPTPAARLEAHVATKKQLPALKVQETAKPVDNSATVSRTVLPPLDVEVVAGQTHKRVRPGNSAKIQVTAPATEPTPAEDLRPATKAAEREPVTSIQSAEPQSYPALAQHMNVQGSVVLQALISAAGQIEDLKVLSGPSILSSAARQAVMEWRFKPMFQNGQAVESKAKITVNFSIRVADGSEKMTLAESRSTDSLIITR